MSKTLLEHGAVVNATEDVRGCVEFTSPLRRHLAPLTHRCTPLASQCQAIPLHYSAYNGHVEFSLTLLEHGADVHATDEVGSLGT